MIKNKVSIIGLGYVGLPLAYAILQNKKYKVVGFDLSEEKIAKLNKGICPIDDKKTAALIKKHKLTVSNNPEIIKESEFIIVCVPTPVHENKLPDLHPIKSASLYISQFLEKGQRIIIESTVNPGVCEEVVLPILKKSKLKAEIDFHLSHCPERINPGDSKWDVYNIPRNIGSMNKEENKYVADFYRSFLKGEINEVSSLKIAEASKIIENTFRDINIAYVNELAKSFDIMGIDLLEVIQASSNKPFAFLPHFPSCGVGGHCIPVDPYYLINRAKKAGFNHGFLVKAREVNESMPKYTIELLESVAKKNKIDLKKNSIGLIGLSYKANVGDLRESPSLKILKILKNKFKNVEVFDPYFPDKSSTKNLPDLLKKIDILIIATNHKEFLKISPKELKKNKIKIVIDGKNCMDKDSIVKEKIIYKGIGH